MGKNSKAYKAANVLLLAVIIYVGFAVAVTIDNAETINGPFIAGAIFGGVVVVFFALILRWLAGRK